MSGLQGAVVTQPHNILGATRHGVEYVRYTTATALSQLLFLAATSTALVISALAVAQLNRAFAGVLAALAAANIGWQLLEFARRVLYTEGRVRTAFLVDALGWASYMATLGILETTGHLTTASAIFSILPTLGAGALLGWTCIRTSIGRSHDTAAYRENWHFGKWLAAAKATYWLSTYLYIYLAAAILGTSASAYL
jgi:hypothetical protein